MTSSVYLKYIEKTNSFVKSTLPTYVLSRGALERQMSNAKRKQAGIAFPPPRKQNHVLIIRFNIIPANNLGIVSDGLRRLCTFLEHLDNGIIQMEDKTDDGEIVWSPLSKYNFTATIGFGKRFFKKHNLLQNSPKYLYDMPEYSELGDVSPYTLQQTDMILQLASSDYSVNRMVLQNDNYLRYSKQYQTKYRLDSSDSEKPALDIVGAVISWANITDVHSGFHRTDGRNLMGFYDGISNPNRLTNDVVWISEAEDPILADGTYMVFQKIEHDLRQWDQMDIRAQEKWVGRSKATGLLLGTLSDEEEQKLASDFRSTDLVRRKQALKRVTRLVDEQRDPTKKLFDPYDLRYNKIYKNCPVSSHVRKANPRERNKRPWLLFRRGYLYIQEEFENYSRSGLLFISFQKDIKIFEDMKKNLAQQFNHSVSTKQLTHVKNYSNQKTLANSFNTQTLGGGYYFIPPIPSKNISEIGQHFFK